MKVRCLWLVAVALALPLDAAPVRLVNNSVRGPVGEGESTIVLGFIISGTGSKKVVVRGVGPQLALAPYNVTGTASDPKVVLYKRVGATNTKVAENDNWDGSDETKAVMLKVGAFNLQSGSKDAVLVAILEAGVYTVHLLGSSDDVQKKGVALAEVYDADIGSTAEFTNLSVRGFVGTGDKVLIAGFVVQGDDTEVFLFRAAGPSLQQFGVSTALEDPVLEVFDNKTGKKVIENDDYPESLRPLFVERGADWFMLGGKDSAVSYAISRPGQFTCVISGKGVVTGVSLGEVFGP